MKYLLLLLFFLIFDLIFKMFFVSKSGEYFFSLNNRYLAIIILILCFIFLFRLIFFDIKYTKSDILFFRILLFAGVISNSIDVLAFGFVRDYISCCKILFNLADVYITISIAYLVIYETRIFSKTKI